MTRLSGISVLILAGTAFIQTANRSSPSGTARVMWEPPAWNLFPVLPKPTVSKEMLAELRVSDLPVRLEETKLDDVATRLGGTIGQTGDAGDFVEWLCFGGTDPGGRWVLWLESGEIDGGMVGSFQWQRLTKGAVLDRRCRMIEGTGVELPVALRFGITEAEILKILGPPTVKQSDSLVYVHQHRESIRGEPYTSTNIVAVLLRGRKVWAIDVSKTTSS
jgi:hypothetical protein